MWRRLPPRFALVRGIVDRRQGRRIDHPDHRTGCGQRRRSIAGGDELETGSIIGRRRDAYRAASPAPRCGGGFLGARGEGRDRGAKDEEWNAALQVQENLWMSPQTPATTPVPRDSSATSGPLKTCGPLRSDDEQVPLVVAWRHDGLARHDVHVDLASHPDLTGYVNPGFNRESDSRDEQALLAGLEVVEVGS